MEYEKSFAMKCSAKKAIRNVADAVKDTYNVTPRVGKKSVSVTYSGNKGKLEFSEEDQQIHLYLDLNFFGKLFRSRIVSEVGKLVKRALSE
jgi:hypothetical protein